ELTVTANDTSGLDATLLVATESADTAKAIQLAFNTIGWKSQNVLFNTVDALLGDPLIQGAFSGAEPAITEAYIKNSTVVAAGEVSVTATNAAQLNATISNAADSTASALYGAKSKSAGALLASNRVSSQALAYVDGGSVHAGGAMEVTAQDT